MESFKYINRKEEIHNQKNQEKTQTDVEQYNLIISNKKGTNYLKLPNGKISKEKIKNKNKKILNNVECNSSKLIGNLNNNNEDKNNDIIKSKTNINTINKNLKKRIVKSKTHDFGKEKYICKKDSYDKKEEFFNINADCIIN